MTFEVWYFILGGLLITVALLASSVKRLPLTETMIYLTAGALLGPLGFGALSLDAHEQSRLLERLSEVAVLVSLFTTGLKLRVPLRDHRWWIPIRLAFASMALTVALVALAGVLGLGLSLGAAILLGAVLAPTDPVLASEVQLENPHDRDRLRFSLTGEAGMNDGTAFPFVMLGLGLLGLHEIGTWGWRWLVVDVAWAIGGGLAIGAACGAAVVRLVLYLRRERREGLGRDEFLALGLIALSYGGALLAHTYGFLAVFAAGLTLRAIEHRQTGDTPPQEVLAVERAGEQEGIATNPETAPAHMAGAVLTFNERMERIIEVALVLIVGAALSPSYLRIGQVWFIALLFLLIRPVSVIMGLLGHRAAGMERAMISWFGIRGIGSLYYLMYAVNRGLSAEVAGRLISITIPVIAVSIIIHGITVTPLMGWYQLRRRRRSKESETHI
jgi:NhaP-type Na+/H+ or K+/H+ antiporter